MKALNIFQVEDNEADILITHEILDQYGFIKSHNTVNTAEEAISYLNKRIPFKTAEKPDLILLDINLPKSSGFAVLVEVKSTPILQDIPVIILTSSISSYDKEFAFKNGADLFLEKPIEIKDFKVFYQEYFEDKETAVRA